MTGIWGGTTNETVWCVYVEGIKTISIILGDNNGEVVEIVEEVEIVETEVEIVWWEKIQRMIGMKVQLISRCRICG